MDFIYVLWILTMLLSMQIAALKKYICGQVLHNPPPSFLILDIVYGICTRDDNEHKEIWKPLENKKTHDFSKTTPKNRKNVLFFAYCNIRYFILDCYYFHVSHAEELLLMEIQTHSKKEAFSILFLTVPSWRTCQTQYNCCYTNL